ncbi:DUF2017 domain-containing protein [Catenulispora sp. NF23]|uniref:DUF2017 domain-containing protein n=1 Tax=Catenulispora pinistramenti TaxID=2705254 RepID=A0ABS5KQC0_9ACTN|nr:DUF2017 domain-containing protein [Catenulispora pinistramenti]MBS2537596.1 DUF2017 domain-containing protein [Catenulispora pinistramenti]MBS2548240.1 DUF2017 domain-containing protein [Catenulispora pinistramenti]
MLQPFKRHRRSGEIVGAFTDGQADVLRFLLTGQLALLDEEDPLGDEPDSLAVALGIADGPVKKPDNPALARLFPDAYGDADEAGEFRRLTEADLREGKRDLARQVLDTLRDYHPGDKLALDGDQARAWLGAVNDIRLVLAVWLEIEDDDDNPFDRIREQDDRYEIVVMYHWLGALVEWLVEALMG